MKAPPPGYHTGALATVANTVLSVVAGFAALWCLNQVLSKEMFGAYSVAMNAVFLAAIVATMGLDRAILLRVSGLGGLPGVMRGSGLALRAGVAVLLAGILVAVLLASAANVVVRAGALPDLSFWLPALSFAVPPFALTWLAQGWFQANHRASRSVILPGLSDIARASFIGLAFVLSAGAQGIALAVVAGACLPLAVAAVWLRASPRRRIPRHLEVADFQGGALFMFQNLTVAGMRYIDVLLLGLLTTGVITADYAIAGRLAAAIDLGRTSLKPTFTPRVRRHLRNGDVALLGREYHALRLGGLLFALLSSAVVAVLGQPVLGLFGEYGSAYAPLLVLASTHVLTAGCGMHSSYLSMSREVVWSAAIRVVSLAMLVVLIVVLAPRFGALGAAFAMFAVQAAVNAFSILLLWHRNRFVAVPLVAACTMGTAIAVLLAGATGLLGPMAVGGMLVLLACAAIVTEREVGRDFLRLLRLPKEPSE